MTRLHTIVGLLVCLVIPGASWLDGSARLAWSMYAYSASYRLRVIAINRDSQRTFIAPTRLATHAVSAVAASLAGSEHWRHAPVGSILRRRLHELAELGCSVASSSELVELILEERKTFDSPVLTTTVRVECARVAKW